MEKARKWIRDFLLGRKPEKKKNDIPAIEYGITSIGTFPGNARVKRRWSFAKIARKVTSPKLSNSLDSIDPSILPREMLLTLSTGIDLKEALPIVPRLPRYRENAAATKIQAAYRSYLARRALHALRALVKLQALVRGYLVRKRSNATLQSMHALMSIQLRARIQRIQLAENEHAVIKQPSRQRNAPADYRKRSAYEEAVDMNVQEMRGVNKSRGGHLNHSHVEKTEHGIATFYSGELFASKRGYQNKESVSNAYAVTKTPHDHAAMSQSNTKASSRLLNHPDYLNPVSADHFVPPSYMTNTKSSRAKVRSHSEPKQRPNSDTRHNNKVKNNASAQKINGRLSTDQRQPPASDSKRYNREMLDPWMLNAHGSTRSVKDSKRDSCSGSTAKSDSNHCNSLVVYI